MSQAGPNDATGMDDDASGFFDMDDLDDDEDEDVDDDEEEEEDDDACKKATGHMFFDGNKSGKLVTKSNYATILSWFMFL